VTLSIVSFIILLIFFEEFVLFRRHFDTGFEKFADFEKRLI
jgi:hypothetical protein